MKPETDLHINGLIKGNFHGDCDSKHNYFLTRTGYKTNRALSIFPTICCTQKTVHVVWASYVSLRLDIVPTLSLVCFSISLWLSRFLECLWNFCKKTLWYKYEELFWWNTRLINHFMKKGLMENLLGLYSLSCKTSYRQISWSLEAARLGIIIIAALWNLTGISAVLLSRCLSNFKAIGKV